MRFVVAVILSFLLISCAHQYTEEQHFNKPNFNDETYKQDMAACMSYAHNKIARRDPVPSSGGLIGALVVGFAVGMSKPHDKANYLIQCMEDKGYVIEVVGLEESRRRANYLKGNVTPRVSMQENPVAEESKIKADYYKAGEEVQGVPQQLEPVVIQEVPQENVKKEPIEPTMRIVEPTSDDDK